MWTLIIKPIKLKVRLIQLLSFITVCIRLTVSHRRIVLNVVLNQASWSVSVEAKMRHKPCRPHSTQTKKFKRKTFRRLRAACCVSSWFKQRAIKSCLPANFLPWEQYYYSFRFINLKRLIKLMAPRCCRVGACGWLPARGKGFESAVFLGWTTVVGIQS